MADFTFCARGCMAVAFKDGTFGFLDPADGTYYDSQGNDVTGYAQNFGGATVLGPADPALIRAAEGMPAPPGGEPSPASSPRGGPPTHSTGTWLTGNTMIAVLGLGILMLLVGGSERR